MTELSIKGIQEAQAANNRSIAALKPRGEFGRAIQYMTAALHSYAIRITHVDTGSLKGSHRMKMKLKQPIRGIIYIDPASVNPRSKQRPARYGVYEEARGGSHAFYTRTEKEAGPKVLTQAEKRIIKGIKI